MCTAGDSLAAAQDQSAVPPLARHIAEQDKRLQEGCTELVIVQRRFAEPGADCPAALQGTRTGVLPSQPSADAARGAVSLACL